MASEVQTTTGWKLEGFFFQYGSQDIQDSAVAKSASQQS